MLLEGPFLEETRIRNFRVIFLTVGSLMNRTVCCLLPVSNLIFDTDHRF